MIKKDDVIIVEITDLGNSGEGVGKYNGFTVFVPDALPGEVVEAQICISKKNYAAAKLLRLVKRSSIRTEPLCPVFDVCGGCQLQHLDYKAQLEIKHTKVVAAFERIGHFQQPPVLETLGMKDPWHYRNKMLFAVSGSKGEPLLGCYAKASHEVANTQTCLIQKEENNLILAAVRAWMSKYGIAPYDEKTGGGLIANVLGRVGVQSGQVLAGIITKEKTVPFLSHLISSLRESLPSLTGVVQIVKKDSGNVVLAGDEHVVWGQGRLRDSVNALNFNISAKSFFQVNSEQAQLLYSQAIEAAGLTGTETVIEAYCGTGTIGMLFAQRAKRVYGLELAPSAIADAAENAKINDCRNIEFLQGDVAQTLPKLLQKGVKPDVLVVDPPRAGLAAKVVETILQALPEKIVYISCNPASLARDAALMKEHYDVLMIKPVDMFPMTAHVESVVLLTRKDG